jgi:hypothetical protein
MCPNHTASEKIFVNKKKRKVLTINELQSVLKFKSNFNYMNFLKKGPLSILAFFQ